MSKDYRETLSIMKTAFPLRVNLPELEQEIEKSWEENNTYSEIINNAEHNPPFILYDGPFNAYGEIHAGHALNRILKDFVIRYRTMSGYYAPYIPAWDMHGLAVENIIMKEGKTARDDVDAFRKRCFEYTLGQAEKLGKIFKRLGIIGDWKTFHYTSQYDYVAEQLKVFAGLVRNNLVYRGLKPVYWSPANRAQLQGDEIVYFDKVSPLIYVTFPVANGRNVISDDCELVIRTTEPWTLLANAAICINSEFKYAVLQTGERYLVVAHKSLDNFIAETSLSDYKIIKMIPGKHLEYITYRHPLNAGVFPVVLGEVNADVGTGLIHIAPGHNEDDFLISKKYHLGITSIVDEGGILNEAAGDFQKLYYEDADPLVTEKLSAVGRLLYGGTTVYPQAHDAKGRRSVILRPVWQWFISVKTLREDLIKNIGKVEWLPSWGKDRMENVIKTSTDWCISRQRLWGVPIPIFYAEDESPVLDADIINHIAGIVEKEGPGVWWRRPARALLPENYENSSSPNGIFTKETDIMDVWFDSGSYHQAAMMLNGFPYPAHLYLEGANQYNGWFYSSLVTGVALTGSAPYRTVLTHGFVLCADGKKISNDSQASDLTELINTFGADVLRLWAASIDYTADVRISPDILKQKGETHRKIRNIFRFMIGNLDDFDYQEHHIPYGSLPELCQMMVNVLNGLIEKVLTAYEHYQFSEAYRALNNYIINDLSAFFLNYSKDILYIEEKDSPRRRGIQTVVYNHTLILLRLLTPIIPHTTEEIYRYLRGKKQKSIYALKMPVATKFANSADLLGNYRLLRQLRRDVLKALECSRKKKLIGSSLMAEVAIKPAGKIQKLINTFSGDWPRIFIVSDFIINEDLNEGDNYESGVIAVYAREGVKCCRCRRIVDMASKEELCENCERIIHKTR